jgi:hypothetical protein
MAAVSFVVLAVYAVVLGLQKKPFATFVATFVPLIFMLAIANDTGRWLQLAVMNAWLLAAALQDQDPDAAGVSSRVQILGVVCLVVLLAMGSTTVSWVNRFSGEMAHRLGLRDTGTAMEWMGKCDPTWRTLLAPSAGKD